MAPDRARSTRNVVVITTTPTCSCDRLLRGSTDRPARGQTSSGLGVVRRQVDRRRVGDVGADALVGEPLGGLVGVDAVDYCAEQSIFGVGGVAARSTAWSPSLTTTASWPGVCPEPGRGLRRLPSSAPCSPGRGRTVPHRKVDQGRPKPGRPALVWVAAKPPPQSCGDGEPEERLPAGNSRYVSNQVVSVDGGIHPG